MNFHELQSNANKRRKRVARGGKRGTTAGRGTKGQKSRAGRKIRPQERDLIIRIPKKRGFNNKTTSPKPKIFNLNDIDNMISRGGIIKEVSFVTLKSVGALPRLYKGEVKVLGQGNISAPISFKGLKVSASAKAKIEKAGGKIL